MIEEIKRNYKAGDIVWIYGVSSNKNKLTKGKIIEKINLESAGYSKNQFFYIVSIDTAIDPLLEIRTWETISQDDRGPVGALREVHDQIDIDNTSRMLSEFGYSYQSEDQEDPSPDEIHAAIIKSQQQSTHSPLILKEPRPVRRRYFKKKKV
jgi:hypothetical protein